MDVDVAPESTAPATTSASDAPAAAPVAPRPKRTSGTPVKSTTPAKSANGSAKKNQAATTPTSPNTGNTLVTGRAKRAARPSNALRESIETAKTLKSPNGEEKIRKSPRADIAGFPSGGFSPSASKNRSGSSKNHLSQSGSLQSPPASARAGRSSTPVPAASASLLPSASPAPPSAPVPQETPRSIAPQLWITHPHTQDGRPVLFFPAFTPPTMTVAAYSYASQPTPQEPPSVPIEPPSNPTSMDVTAETIPSEAAPPPPPPVPAVHPATPLSKLQQQYNSGNAHFGKLGGAMNPSLRHNLTVPAYTTAQIRQVQHQPATFGDLQSLNPPSHPKKTMGDPATCASTGRVFIIDNGAYSAKLGFSTDSDPLVIHNMIGKPKAAKRKYVGAELGLVHGAYSSVSSSSSATSKSKTASTSTSTSNGGNKKQDAATCNDFRSLSITRAHDRGYVLNWDLQAQIWALDQIFGRKYGMQTSQSLKKSGATPVHSGDPSDIPESSSHCLILTEAHLAPFNLRQKLFEWVFETAKFGSLFVCSSAYLSLLYHRHVASYTSEEGGRILCEAGEHKESPVLPAVSVNPCCVVVDVGYSFTHVTPFYEEYKMNYAIRRLNVGGKVMTNLLRELVSFRHFNMMDQTYLMGLIKERLCYVSQDFRGDVKKSRLKKNEIRKHYILPDQTTSILGYVYGTQPTAADLGSKPTSTSAPTNKNNMDLDDFTPADAKKKDNKSNKSAATMNAETQAQTKNQAQQQQQQAPQIPEDAQILSLGNERFSVPEVLFHPSDVGLNQAGIAEVIMQSINAAPEYLREALCCNIVLVGASAAIPGLPERLLAELRPLLPTHYVLRIYLPPSPGTTAWHGGKYLATQRAHNLDQLAVSAQQYQESGSHIPKHRFALY